MSSPACLHLDEELEGSSKEEGECTGGELGNIVHGGGTTGLGGSRLAGGGRGSLRCATLGSGGRGSALRRAFSDGDSFSSSIASTTLLVVGANLLSRVIVGVVGDALDVGLLADEERQSVGERRDIGSSAVAANAGVGQLILSRC